MDARAELVLAILEACEEEGEDVPFASLLEDIACLRPRLAPLAKRLAARYGSLPPRVALAMMARDPAWRKAVREGSSAYLSSPR
ncbi:hypothetical protein DRO60_02560 [Candidatus Bathyarchaeota archaeon]|nr:MAG: hypothetical protein DRO60_02560 [Candidatus Bathyarchaeota archaeon]